MKMSPCLLALRTGEWTSMPILLPVLSLPLCVLAVQQPRKARMRAWPSLCTKKAMSRLNLRFNICTLDGKIKLSMGMQKRCK